MNRILIVDDEPAVVAALQRLLKTHPCRYGKLDYRLEVETFNSPQQALDRAREASFDLVLSDYHMPGMNGIEFLGAFRQLQPDAVRIVLSGLADIDEITPALLDIDTRRFLPKPWNDSFLMACIAEALTLRELELERRAKQAAQ
jgi:CheY-like chemotaxis protein